MKTHLEPQELVHYKSILDEKLVDFTELVRQRLRKKFDVIIAITGDPGLGKSHLGIWLGMLIDQKYDLQKNIAYLPTPAAIQKKFHEIKRLQVIQIDESSKGAHKHGWQDKRQKDLMTMYDTERFQQKCTISLIPRFRNFAENFRNNRIMIWFHILSRDHDKKEAVAVCYIKDSDKDCDDPWHVKDNFKLKNKKNKWKKMFSRTVGDRLDYERRTINYLFDFKFPPLPKELGKTYDNLKLESRKISVVEEEEAKIDVRHRAWLILLKDLLKAGKLQKKEIIEYYKVPKSTLYRDVMSLKKMAKEEKQ